MYSSTAKDSFNPNKKFVEDIKYKYSRANRFNPITGESCNTTFGFEDFVPKYNKGYKANNFTMVPRSGERIDIISGRKLTYG